MSKTRWIILVAAILLLALIGLAIRNDSLRRQEYSREFQERFTKKWLAEEKQALVSGERSGIYFYDTTGTDLLLQHFAGMPELKQLTFESTDDLTVEGMKLVAALPALTELSIYSGNPRFGDRELAALSNHPTLQKLSLVNTEVTNPGLAVLPTMPRLTELTLSCEGLRSNRLTDVALPHLLSLGQLKKLTLNGGWMSQPALAELRTALPNCQIEAKANW